MKRTIFSCGSKFSFHAIFNLAPESTVTLLLPNSVIYSLAEHIFINRKRSKAKNVCAIALLSRKFNVQHSGQSSF